MQTPVPAHGADASVLPPRPSSREMPEPTHSAMRMPANVSAGPPQRAHVSARLPGCTDANDLHHAVRSPAKPWDTSPNQPCHADTSARRSVRMLAVAYHAMHRSAPAYQVVGIPAPAHRALRLSSPPRRTNISATISYKYHCVVRFKCQSEFTYSSNTIWYLVLAFRTA